MTSNKNRVFQRLFRAKNRSQKKSIRIPEWFDYTLTEQNVVPAVRDLTTCLVEKYYPKEDSIVDKIIDQLLDEYGLYPLSVDSNPNQKGLGYYGHIGDLGSVKAFGFLAILMLELTAVANAGSKTIAESIRDLPKNQDLYKKLVRRAQEEFDLGSKSTHRFLDTLLDIVDPHFNFILANTVPMEKSRYCEFRMHKSHSVEAVGKDACEYIVGFLNRGGGRIYFGISDRDRIVRGIKLSRSDRDDLRQYVVNKTRTMNPSVYSDKYRINFHQVSDENGNEIHNLFVIEIIVPFTLSTSGVRTSEGRKIVKTEIGVDWDWDSK